MNEKSADIDKISKEKDTEKGFLEQKFEIFNYKHLGEVRTFVDRNGNKWFCLKDVCNLLNINEPHGVAKRIPDPYTITNRIGINTGVRDDGTPAIQYVPHIFINETGLYIAIGSSRKPEAKKVMEWVYSDVMPKLNKNGYYIMENKPLIDMVRDLVNKMDELKELVIESSDKYNFIELITSKDKVRINNYAKLIGYPLNNRMASYLGKKASQISVEWGVNVGTEPHEEYGTVHLYRRDIVKYVFDKYYEEADILYGNDNEGDE